MKNAVKTSFHTDDEQGAADNAAVLGADGGPAPSTVSTDLALIEGEFDDEWLDEELSDEELAALGEEDFEAAFADDFDVDDTADEDNDGEFVTGDLEEFDELDEFELLEGPVDAAPTVAMGENQRSAPSPEATAGPASSASPGFQMQQPDGEFGDDLFEIGEADDDDVNGLSEEPPLTTNPDTTAQFASQEDDFEHISDHETEGGYDDSDPLEFTADDDFSIEDDFSDSEEASIGSAAIVKVGPTEVKSREKGTVAAPASVEDSIDDTEFDDDIEDAFDDFEEEEDGTYHRPVPRISIHAFCETSRNSSILERAAVDRRLSKAHFTLHMGGVEKAVDLYQSNSTPNLIILETIHGGVQLIQQLGQLAEVCDPSTKVIVIGRVNDIRLYRELIRQGISEYIVRPKSPLQIIKTISELYVDPSAPPIGKTIAFVGTRGGVGSSTLAHNVGWSMAEDFQSDTVILDLDLPFGTTALDFDHEPTSGLMEALSSPERLDDVLLERLLQKHTDHLSLFTAPNMLDREYDIDDEAYDTVIDIVRGTAPTVVIDVPHNWTGWSKKILQTADEIVITATPDFASFRNMKYLMEVIGASRPNDSKPYFIYNQFDPKTSAVPVEYFVENIDLEPSLILGWEPQLFNQAATNAAPIMESSPKSKVAQGLNELSGKILGRTQTLALPSRFSLTSLFKRK